MSKEYEGQNPIDIAKQAEEDLNSTAAKTGGHSHAESSNESGINTNVTEKFPGSTATYGSEASGAGDNRTIPVSEGGDIIPSTGRETKARDFEGEGGPEDKVRRYAEDQGGNDDVSN